MACSPSPASRASARPRCCAGPRVASTASASCARPAPSPSRRCRSPVSSPCSDPRWVSWTRSPRRRPVLCRRPSRWRRGLPVTGSPIGAATLSLLCRYAEDAPVAVLLDDVHLLDRSSASALVFAARRLRLRPRGDAGGGAGWRGRRPGRGPRPTRPRRARQGCCPHLRRRVVRDTRHRRVARPRARADRRQPAGHRRARRGPGRPAAHRLRRPAAAVVRPRRVLHASGTPPRSRLSLGAARGRRVQRRPATDRSGVRGAGPGRCPARGRAALRAGRRGRRRRGLPAPPPASLDLSGQPATGASDPCTRRWPPRCPSTTSIGGPGTSRSRCGRPMPGSPSCWTVQPRGR